MELCLLVDVEMKVDESGAIYFVAVICQFMNRGIPWKVLFPKDE